MTTSSRIEVTIECDTWAASAPWGRRTVDIIEQPDLEAGRRLAHVLAAEHGPRCTVTIHEKSDDGLTRTVEDVRGTLEGCEQTEVKAVAAMVARGEDRAEIRNRIEWARGHALINDNVAEALHVVNGRA